MIKLSDLQETLVSRLQAHAALANVPILADMGTEADTASIEGALSAKGACISVTVPLAARLSDQKAGAAILTADIAVMISVNIERNNSENNEEALEADMFSLIEEVAQAVVRGTNVVEQDRFRFADDAVSLDVLDAGLFRYQLTFTKRCVI